MDGNMEQTVENVVDQGSMESDYLNEYQLIDDKGNPVSDETEQVEETVKEETNKPDDSEKQAQPEKSDGAVDFVKDFYKEDGTLDFSKAMGLFQKPAVEQKPVEQAQQPVIPPAQEQKQQEATDPQASMRENYLAAIKLQRYYMQQGFDADTAMQKAEQYIEANLQQYFVKSEMQKMREEFEAKLKAKDEEVKSERELAIAEPKAQQNLMSICNKYAKGLAAETLQKAIFDINIGGQFFVDLFNMTNPDKANLTGEPLRKSMNDWFIKNAAKNPNFVESLAVNAINQIQRRVIPDMIKEAQKNAVQRTATQKRNNLGPRPAQQPQVHKPAEQSGADRDLDIFLGNIPRDSGGRPHI